MAKRKVNSEPVSPWRRKKPPICQECKKWKNGGLEITLVKGPEGYLTCPKCGWSENPAVKMGKKNG